MKIPQRGSCEACDDMEQTTEAPRLTRDEHLQWAKDRALEYVQRGDLKNAVASMLSDMNKHPETADVSGFLAQVGMMHVVRHDVDAVKRWIEGFN